MHIYIRKLNIIHIIYLLNPNKCVYSDIIANTNLVIIQYKSYTIMKYWVGGEILEIIIVAFSWGCSVLYTHKKMWQKVSLINFCFNAIRIIASMFSGLVYWGLCDWGTWKGLLVWEGHQQHHFNHIFFLHFQNYIKYIYLLFKKTLFLIKYNDSYFFQL